MKKPTLLFVEEIRNSLSEKVVSRKDIQLVLLRFKQSMSFDEKYLKKTAAISCFVLDKEVSVKGEVERFKIFCRDNNLKIDYFKCQKCGRSPATDPSIILHIDHIKPWAKSGETVLENLQTLCSICNIGKSDLE